MPSDNLFERDALYYPYIHIRSAEWLKRTLLIFPHVARIVPRDFSPIDLEEVSRFENVLGRHDKPLLRPVNLDSAGVWEAQHQLLHLMREDINKDPRFFMPYTFENYRAAFRGVDEEFRLHVDKPLAEIIWFLDRYNLSWPARGGNPYDRDVALHPVIGSLIMSTIALACAKDEGFDVVTDEGRLHYEGGSNDVPGIYQKLVHGVVPNAPAFRATGDELFELVVFQQCDVEKLTPERLSKLSEDREAIDALRLALAEIAGKIPEMQNRVAFEDRLKASVNDALGAWKNNRMNMSSVSKEMFGRDLLKPTEGFVKGLVEKFAASAIGAVGGAAGGGSSGMLIGAAGGFVVALVAHGVTSWGRASDRSRKSPYRYLTTIEKAGVAFSMAK
ncbi:MAG TPA: hypothetical protein VNR39_19305 [Pseudolabrys sp.]|nr:hypothetical protein [Pseudolabrys sp.]